MRQLGEHVDSLAQAQQRTEQRVEGLAQHLDQLTERVDRLTERVVKLTERVDRLTERVDKLAEHFDKLTERVDQLTEHVDQLGERMDQLVEAQQRTERSLAELIDTVNVLGTRQARLRGDVLELKYARKAHAYFGRYLRRLRVLLPDGLDETIEDRLEAALSDDEVATVLLLDLLAVGRPRRRDGWPDELWLATEVSAVIDRHDVERASERAALVRKAGLAAIPVVAGESVTEGATELLQDLPVVLVLNGRSEGWDRAVRAIA
jgi:uncharacterized protein YoxC